MLKKTWIELQKNFYIFSISFFWVSHSFCWFHFHILNLMLILLWKLTWNTEIVNMFIKLRTHVCIRSYFKIVSWHQAVLYHFIAWYVSTWHAIKKKLDKFSAPKSKSSLFKGTKYRKILLKAVGNLSAYLIGLSSVNNKNVP